MKQILLKSFSTIDISCPFFIEFEKKKKVKLMFSYFAFLKFYYSKVKIMDLTWWNVFSILTFLIKKENDLKNNYLIKRVFENLILKV